jgi:predicted dehydrogenase
MAAKKKTTKKTKTAAKKSAKPRRRPPGGDWPAGKPVRVGIVGCGGMGSHHARYLDKGEVDGAVLSAVCDIDPARLDWAKQNLASEISLHEEPSSVIRSGDVDAIMIATPHYDHPPIAVEAFGQDLHVLTEKPAGVYTQQIREMNEAAEASGKVFGIMFQMRAIPVYQKVRELITSGELGEIRRFNWIITSWFRSQSYYDSGGWRASWAGEGGGVLTNQCPHNLDLWQWITGLPQRVRAFCYFGKYHEIEVEDDVTIYAEYENGATGLFIATTGEAPGTNRLEITGDNGTLVIEHNQLTFFRNRTPADKFCKEYTGGFGQPESWRCEVPVRGQAGGHAAITQNWIRGIREGSDLLAPGVEGIRGVEISNAAYLSAWTDDWVDLPVPEKKYKQELEKRIKNSTFKKKKSGKTLDVKTSW